MDKILNMIGLAKKAGRLEVGEEPTGAAARARDARLLLLASDAAENSARRLRHFADAGQCLWVRLPVTKDALGSAVGRSSCAMCAVTDIGFATAIAKKLAELDDNFNITAEKLELKAQRAAERRKEAEAHKRNVRMGKKKKTPAPAAAEEKKSAESAAEKKPTVRKATVRRTESKNEREQRRRESAKRAAAKRYIGSRPVKKGKGSQKKEQA